MWAQSTQKIKKLQKNGTFRHIVRNLTNAGTFFMCLGFLDNVLKL